MPGCYLTYLWWFEEDISSTGSCTGRLCPQLAVLFKEAMDGVQHEALVEEVQQWDELRRFTASLCFLRSLSLALALSLYSLSPSSFCFLGINIMWSAILPLHAGWGKNHKNRKRKIDNACWFNQITVVFSNVKMKSERTTWRVFTWNYTMVY